MARSSSSPEAHVSNGKVFSAFVFLVLEVLRRSPNAFCLCFLSGKCSGGPDANWSQDAGNFFCSQSRNLVGSILKPVRLV